MVIIIVGIVVCAAAYGLGEMTGVGGDAAFFIMIGIIVGAFALLYLITKMIEKAETKNNVKIMKVFKFLGKSGMTVSGISVVAGIIMFLVGFFTSDGRYGYELHWSGKNFFLTDAMPVFMWAGIFIAVVGVILFLVSCVCYSVESKKNK